MTEETPPLPPLADLLDVLTLTDIGTARINVTDPLGRDAPTSIGAESARVFLGRSQRMPHGRVFGGQVLAQCIMAAGLTISTVADVPRPIHSLHGYFMRPGDDTKPIHFAVEEMRDGHSFSTRRVHAIQKRAPIMSLVCSFQEHARGLDHQEPMPPVPGPDGLPSLRDLADDHPATRRIAAGRPIEQRHVESSLYLGPGDEHVPVGHVWLRSIGALPDDPLLHAAVLAYASDYTLLEPVLRRHGLAWRDPRLRVASLDHSMWFHRAADPSDWILYAQRSPSATSGRGLSIGEMFTRDGALVATTAQEGMIRVKES
ncbi:acyl-CoA thioesterase II [Intrasporangium sp.]|uniref:acyl-CoA thioesterase n=1 Tax=Intrasporangium sp. TaxID=1925024 RepID=UPI0032217DDC